MNQNKEASKHVVIIGTGAGGVALAARLAHAGFRVSVYEKNDYSGGRLSLIEKDGFRFDQGPSLYLMPKIFQETFNDLGVSMEKHYKLVRCDPNYRLYFEDGKTLDLCSDLNTMKDRLHEWDPQNSFDDFQKASRVHYEASVGYVLTKLFQKWFDFFNVNNLKLVPKLNLHQSLYSFAAKHFQNPQLRQAFTFQSMYMGMSPFDAPATYSLLQYTEFAEVNVA
ncbi:hypothetical protein HMI54_005661 [Coelomomyces lativittatus]|nr:hypothetical protein HMI54_005661 [Coelomomyces lativittatus]